MSSLPGIELHMPYMTGVHLEYIYSLPSFYRNHHHTNTPSTINNKKMMNSIIAVHSSSSSSLATRSDIGFLGQSSYESQYSSSCSNHHHHHHHHRTRPHLVNLNLNRKKMNMKGAAATSVSGGGSQLHKPPREEEEEDAKSDTYSTEMTQAMGAVLTYRHELGINYNFIRPDLIVGSCLQSPQDLDTLRSIGVKTVFCLQQDPDLDYFGVDIHAIQQHAATFQDIQHIRAEIRDFDAFDLRIRLPAVVSQLYKAVNANGGVTYIHCTASLGRAPAVALAYMYWVQGYKLNEAHKWLQSKRSCFPKLEAIKNATADILTGLNKKTVTLAWKGHGTSKVEISGLDIGWGPRIDLRFDAEQDMWILERELLEGRYEYKYIVDGEWVCNKDELITTPNKDGHVNNYVQVDSEDPNGSRAALRKRLTGDDPNLTKYERAQIRDFLEA